MTGGRFITTGLAAGLLALINAPIVADAAQGASPATCQRLPSTCNQPCSPMNCRSCGVYAGVEATFLAPVNADGTALLFNSPGAGFAALGLSEFDTLEGAPRVWLGYQGECWGVRGRYWTFDADRFGEYFDFASRTDYRYAQSSYLFTAKTADLEATRRFGVFGWEGDLFLGGRWAEMAQEQRMSIDTISPFVRTSKQQGRLLTDGVGLTFGLEGRRPIGDRGLALKINARGSALWGNHSVFLYNEYFEPGNLAVQLAGVDNACSTLTIAELQAGLEWSAKIQRFRAEVFTHIMFEYQWWQTDGATPVLLTQTVNGTTTSVCSGGGDADLVGLAWAIGFRR